MPEPLSPIPTSASAMNKPWTFTTYGVRGKSLATIRTDNGRTIIAHAINAEHAGTIVAAVNAHKEQREQIAQLREALEEALRLPNLECSLLTNEKLDLTDRQNYRVEIAEIEKEARQALATTAPDAEVKE